MHDLYGLCRVLRMWLQVTVVMISVLHDHGVSFFSSVYTLQGLILVSAARLAAPRDGFFRPLHGVNPSPKISEKEAAGWRQQGWGCHGVSFLSALSAHAQAWERAI